MERLEMSMGEKKRARTQRMAWVCSLLAAPGLPSGLLASLDVVPLEAVLLEQRLGARPRAPRMQQVLDRDDVLAPCPAPPPLVEGEAGQLSSCAPIADTKASSCGRST
jgi:hypothetical protein